MTGRVHRYRSLLALTGLLAAVGVASGTPTLLLAGVVPLAYVVVGALSTAAPLAERVRVTREVDPESPLPRQPVSVTLTVENVGDAALPDLRFVDGVPAELAVDDGDARASASLRSGASASATYTLVADRGRYAFGPVTLRARGVAGTTLSDATVEADGDGAFECRVVADDVPLVCTPSPFAGTLTTNTGGEGVEFHATREYRAGDPVSRINWNRYAKTGELSTVEYREQRAGRVVVLVDGRPPAHVGAGPSQPTGATLCAYAGTLALNALVDEGHHVAVCALGTPDPVSGADAPAWASADDADSFAARAAAICNAAASGPETAAASDQRAAEAIAVDGGIDAERDRLLALLPADAQVLFCTPALDSGVSDLAESIRVRGHPLTVLSPDVLPESVGGRVEAMARAGRLDDARALGAVVVDWNREERLSLALARTIEGVRR